MAFDYRNDAKTLALAEAKINAAVARARKKIAGRISALSWAGTVPTVTLTEGRVYIENNGGAYEAKIAPVAATALGASMGIVLDVKNGARDGSDRIIPDVVNMFGTTGSGWMTRDKYILVGNGGFNSLIGEYYLPPPEIPAATYDPAEIVIKKISNQIDIYMKGSNPTSDKYLRYRMMRTPFVSRNSDVWTWNQTWEAQRTGVTTFADTQRVIAPAENIIAIKQTGMGDFMGGYVHGNEQTLTITVLVDGAEVDVSTSENLRGRRIEFIQSSNLTEHGNPSVINGVKYMRAIFENGQVDIHNHIEWVKSINLENAYMAMLGLERFNGVQVSDKGYRSPLFLEEDIGEAGFTQINTSAGYAKATGPSGYGAEVEIVKGWDKPNRNFNFSPAAIYNKFYFNFTGSDYQTEIGEVFESLARYRIDTRN